MKYNYLFIGNFLRIKRLEMNYSIRSLARQVGMSDTELSRWENGERINYNLILLIRLCEILNINFIRLLKASEYLPLDYTEDTKILNNNKHIEQKNNNKNSNYVCIYIPRELCVIGDTNE